MLQRSAIDMNQVEQELRAQIDRFVQLAGAAPDHLDSHHHITYASPGIAAVMLQLAAELDVPIRNAFPEISGAQDGTTTNERKDMTHGDSAWRDLLASSRVSMPAPLMDAFYDEHATLGDLLNVLMDTPPDGVSELMCHPAVPDDDLRTESVYADRRGDELEALTHPSVLELVAAAGIELITFQWFAGNRSPKQ